MTRRTARNATNNAANGGPGKARGGLARYRRKRRFDVTPEPKGRVAARGGNLFIVQKHAARRLHYDFRLELDGVLKSWAVTKGPSLDPAVRRLAVHVEDHPRDYASFEGTIPKGEYGGGTVMLWDRGTWEPLGDPHLGYAKGKLKFRLDGEHLKGGWALVRMGGWSQEKGHDNWLLIKERDGEARPGEADALLDKVKRSVKTGRTMAEIETGKRPRKRAKHARAAANARRGAKKSPASKRVSKRTTARARPSKAGDPARSIAAIPGVKRGPLPDFIPPQLATLVDKAPSGKNWIHEIKFDGYRVFCRREGRDVRFLTRTGQDWTEKFGALRDAVLKLPAKSFALDGEITVLDANDASSFAALQQALSAGEDDKLRYFVFDLLYLDGFDLRGAALAQRKRMLRALVPFGGKPGAVRFSDHIEASGPEVYRHACQMALEGVVSKRGDLPYRSGRWRDWVKTKCYARQEFVIGGYALAKTARWEGIGALLLGVYEEEALRYAGKVGTGFTQEVSADLLRRLRAIETVGSPFAGTLPAAARRGAHWVKPKLVCEVNFLSWTRDGVLRQPSFQGLREDKPARQIRRERPSRAESVSRRPTTRDARETASRSRNGNTVAGVVITHPSREVFPEMGISKLALARYYDEVAEWILPEVRGRPLSVVRCPEGTANQCFYQKHFETGLKALERVAIEEKDGTGDYVVVRDSHDLVSLVQEGVVEIHPWGSRADDPESPDRLVFDMDPGPGVKWSRTVEATLTMRDMLEELELTSFAKTTGGKGLHVAVPLKRGLDWRQLKDFSRAVAALAVEARPSSYTISPLKRNRDGKIFIDYLRNDRGSTAVAPYSVRARAHAPVAMPLPWNDVGPRLDPKRFTVETVPGILRRRRKDPWAEMGKLRQTIPAAALRALGVKD